MNDTVNPFTVRTPEDIEADEALKLWVDVFTDFQKIRDPGHSMLNGPRGCGKSMMFRFLQSDCQCLDNKCELRDLPFFGVLVSIKNTDLNLTDLQRLAEVQTNAILNEHFLVMYVASRTFLELSKRAPIPNTKDNARAAVSFANQFLTHLRLSGWTGEEAPTFETDASPKEIFAELRRYCDRLYREVIAYVRGLSFPGKSTITYGGPLCGYLDFLYPMLEDLRELPFLPNGPIYLLMDDADYLNHTQTMILNSWLSTRTSASVSIKVSTQLKYKTYRSVSGMTVSSPHDYSEVNITDIYTSSKSKYVHLVQNIVHKRLKSAGIQDVTPCEFFPEDEKQEQEIEAIRQKLLEDWRTSGRGHRPGDDAIRYARPMFIAGLKGQRKSGSTYSYAGFKQLVHISSGLVRFFLEPAALMFNEELAWFGSKPIKFIRPATQNQIIRDEAAKLIFTEFDKMFKDEESEIGEGWKRSKLYEQKMKLQALLAVLGGVFHAKLISEDSERRVFSVAFSDTPAPELEELFKLGIQYGYFHRSTIGNKDGTGRTALYILTRRLAPYFTLDPSGFAGYLFVTSARLQEAIADPDKFLRQLKARGGVDEAFEERQLRLFD
jgi:hypothetical protein